MLGFVVHVVVLLDVYFSRKVVSIPFLRRPQPPPTTVTMVAGGGGLILLLHVLIRSWTNGLRLSLSLKVHKSRFHMK